MKEEYPKKLGLGKCLIVVMTFSIQFSIQFNLFSPSVKSVHDSKAKKTGMAQFKLKKVNKQLISS